MVLHHNSGLFLSQALWPPQTYRAYLSIGHYWPLVTYVSSRLCNGLSRKQTSVSAPLRQLFDLEGTHEQRLSVCCLKRCFTLIHSDGHASLSKQASGSSHCIYTCPYCAAENIVSCAASVLVCRQEILKQNREGVSRLCFPRSHTTSHTHINTETHVLRG